MNALTALKRQKYACQKGKITATGGAATAFTVYSMETINANYNLTCHQLQFSFLLKVKMKAKINQFLNITLLGCLFFVAD